MKKLLLLVPFTIFGATQLSAQCTPVDCSASLPSYGGTCDSMLNDGNVNVVYDDFESFVMNNECFDAGVFDPANAGTNIQIDVIHDITFASLPAGITGTTNLATYNTTPGVNTLGCASFTGTPTEIGVFNGTIDLLVDVTVCGFIPIPLADQNAQYVMWLTVKPDPTFTGLVANYTVADPAVNLTVTGTSGGTFSGPGVTGTSFDPAAAGVGSHSIKYLVSAQEGAAIAPAADSMIVVVNVGTSGLEEGALSALNVYPNPTENTLSIAGLEGITEKISILNSYGQVITSFSNVNTSVHDINVENLETGIYFVRVNQNNYSKVIRFVKK